MAFNLKLILLTVLIAHASAHMYYKRPHKSTPFSRAMDARNRELLRLRRETPLLSSSRLSRMADLAAERLLRDEAAMASSPADRAQDACSGGETNPTEELMCRTHSNSINCDRNARYRSFDGTCNNLWNPLLGALNTKFDRMLSALYRDGVGEPYGDSAFNYRADAEAGEEAPHDRWYWGGWGGQQTDDGKCQQTYPNQLPEPRKVSVSFHRAQDVPDRQLSLMLMQFGQFVDHDLTLTPEASAEVECCDATQEVVEHSECFSIAVPPGDAFVRNFNLTCLEFRRSTAFCPDSEPTREQFNTITHFLDTSNVYASDPRVSCLLRTGSGGQLRTSETAQMSSYLPLLDDPRVAGGDVRLVGGDIRALEMAGLASMHTIWLREHNGIAAVIADNVNGLSDEDIFQEARRIVNAEYQNVVFRDFLMSVLGYRKVCDFGLRIDGYSDYNCELDPAILNEFATAAYRFGHTLIQDTVVPRNVSSAKEALDGYMLRDVFFNDVQLNESLSNGGVDRILVGIAQQQSQSFDQFIAEDVSNLLRFDFGSPRSDLIARNIQRSRDHGLRGYNDYREECGLRRACDWDDAPAEISAAKWAELSRLYNHPNDIELFPGGLAEAPVSGGVVGPTFACIIGEQFKRLRFGDRFFFTHRNQAGSLSPRALSEASNQLLSDILCRNIPGLPSIRRSVFDLSSQEVLDCSQSRLDISAFFGVDNPMMSKSGVTAKNGPWMMKQAIAAY